MGEKKKIVYLFGAGASHGSVQAVGCGRGILMSDLSMPLADEVRELITTKKKFDSLKSLVNQIVCEEMDVEHIITFLDQSPSMLHRQFAEELRIIFAKVLREELNSIERDIGEERYGLISALLDMYQANGCQEELAGILSINYDEYVEAAAEAVFGEAVDYGIFMQGDESKNASLKLIKLHGSFNWSDTWPVQKNGQSAEMPLWIAPGIQKAKEGYPFGVLWGLAREMLDCDVLRIVGCRLSGNDWDLISLLFATRHTHFNSESPYVVEVIDSPKQAFELKDLYPYLDIRSVFEIEELGIGAQLISEIIGGPPRSFAELTNEEEKQAALVGHEGKNWFSLWLKQMAEAFVRELGSESVNTPAGFFSNILGEA